MKLSSLWQWTACAAALVTGGLLHAACPDPCVSDRCGEGVRCPDYVESRYSDAEIIVDEAYNVSAYDVPMDRSRIYSNHLRDARPEVDPYTVTFVPTQRIGSLRVNDWSGVDESARYGEADFQLGTAPAAFASYDNVEDGTLVTGVEAGRDDDRVRLGPSTPGIFGRRDFDEDTASSPGGPVGTPTSGADDPVNASYRVDEEGRNIQTRRDVRVPNTGVPDNPRSAVDDASFPSIDVDGAQPSARSPGVGPSDAGNTQGVPVRVNPGPTDIQRPQVEHHEISPPAPSPGARPGSIDNDRAR